MQASIRAATGCTVICAGVNLLSVHTRVITCVVEAQKPGAAMQMLTCLQFHSARASCISLTQSMHGLLFQARRMQRGE